MWRPHSEQVAMGETSEDLGQKWQYSGAAGGEIEVDAAKPEKVAISLRRLTIETA
jgi:hypothetical protein